MGNQAGIIIRNVKNELFHSAKRLILNEVKGIECLHLFTAIINTIMNFNRMSTLKQMLIKVVPSFLTKKIAHYKYKIEWKKRNRNNMVVPIRYVPVNCVDIGNYSYGKLNVLNCRDDVKIKIGRFCSIADEVTFLLSVEHPLDYLSTYPFISMIHAGKNIDAISKGDIIIEDDVWIGYRATIMSGVKIGRGAVIAAGAIVTKDIPPYSIAGGVPAKVIKYRFSNEIISKLVKINYSKIEKKLNKNELKMLYTNVGEDNIDELLNLFI